MLHELDRELEKRDCRFVRYADDFSIYTKSKAAARRIGNQVYLFLKQKLRLPINREMPEHASVKGTHVVPVPAGLLPSVFWDMNLRPRLPKEIRASSS